MSHHVVDIKSTVEQTQIIPAHVYNATIFFDMTHQHFQKITITQKESTLKFLQEQLKAEEKRTIALQQTPALKETYEALLSEALSNLNVGKKLINRAIKFNKKHPKQMKTAAYLRCAYESFYNSKKDFTRGLFLYKQYMHLLQKSDDEVYAEDIQTLIKSASQYYKDSYACLRGFMQHVESTSQKTPSPTNNGVSTGYFPGLSHRLK